MLTLDRMAIEEAGPNPERVAAAIHKQLKLTYGPVPVVQIATALDIVDIRVAPLRSCEAALIMPDDRGVGAIAVNSASSPQRRKFGVGHELGHFLNPWHRPLSPDGSFLCGRFDLGNSWRRPPREATRHLVQESEANRFAIELLAPPQFVRRRLGTIPDLLHVLDLADDLDISREAAARRYVELHSQPCALVFFRTGKIRYIDFHPDFPPLSCARGQRVAGLPPAADARGISAHEEAAAADWLRRSSGDNLVIQTLTQREGYSITLLFENAEDEADELE